MRVCPFSARRVLTCTASAAIALASGARLSLGTLSLSEDATISIEGPGRLVVTRRLDSEELARLTVDGLAVHQTLSGRISPRRGAVIYLR